MVVLVDVLGVCEVRSSRGYRRTYTEQAEGGLEPKLGKTVLQSLGE